MKQLIEKLARKNDSHKGENGKIAVIAGSRDYTGAPALSAKAALRTGSDLTKILTSEKISQTVASYSENLIVRDYPEDYLSVKSLEKAKKVVEWSDVVVIGPGLGEPEPEVVEKIIEYTEKPKIIDADAIKPALETDLENCIFTPHEGEAEAIREKYGSLENFSREKDAVVLLKGKIDRIYVKGEEKTSETGDPTMTVGGTGDVLTGILASLIGQGLENSEAAFLGAWINGKAGEKAAERYGNGALATDIVEKIPQVMKNPDE